MQTRRWFIGLAAGVLAFWSVAAGAQGIRLVNVNIAPQHGDWVYKPGEKVKFDVSVTRNDVLLRDVEIRYEFGPDMMPPTGREQMTLKDGKTTIDAGTMKTAGFLRCRVYAKYDGKEYDGVATAAFSPETIKPTVNDPADFTQFWDKAKADLAKIPMNARMMLLPERCTDKVNVFHVRLQNINNSAWYGILTVPKAPGKYPAILKVPGAGIRPYNGDTGNAARGAVVFEVGIHGIPVNMNQDVYDDLGRGALQGYPTINLDDKDRYYYKRVYLGCVRSVDFIFSLPEFDGSNIVVTGGSQGGALSIVTAGLDSRIKGLAAFYPALSDVTGYLNGRAGGWPHMFSGAGKELNNTPKKLETAGYYDVVNFARRVKVPGFYSWGYNDVTCPPTSMYSAYNVIAAPKTLYLLEETGHWNYSEQWEKAFNWVFEMLKR